MWAMSKIVVTGGAGFIGSHLVDRLVERGHDVVVFDSLDPQVHAGRVRPRWLNSRAAFVEADVRDRAALLGAIDGADAVFHFAAAVGVGQSMYEIESYVDVNTRGTAVLLELVAKSKARTLRKLVVASSMSIYGEGAYRCASCGVVEAAERAAEDLDRGRWEPVCACGRDLAVIATAESKPLRASSIYAQSKRHQEEMCLLIGRAYDVPTTALRFFNVYGARQSLSNPYTGVAAIFASRFLNARPPIIFEDGEQQRDFVHVRDIVRAALFVLDDPRTDGAVYNIGTGVPASVNRVAELLAARLGVDIAPERPRRWREGDVRHCFADVSHLAALGFRAETSLDAGIGDLVDAVRDERPVDGVEHARDELLSHGLLRG
jgi:dTDP-L-rhamnose 4-epimerase